MKSYEENFLCSCFYVEIMEQPVLPVIFIMKNSDYMENDQHRSVIRVVYFFIGCMHYFYLELV